MSMPGFGTSIDNSELLMILNDLLADQGTAITDEQGSLAWCECLTIARSIYTAQQFSILLSRQLNASTANYLQNRYADIYAQPNTSALLPYLKQNQQLFGLIPNTSNVTAFIKKLLGNCFISFLFFPQLQYLATNSPIITSYQSPLSKMFVYCWQPRDNKDNLLMDNITFQNTVNQYHVILNKWIPSFTKQQLLVITNRGNQDGYCNNYHPGVIDGSQNYNDGHNVVSGSINSQILTGVGTTFQSYYNGSLGDFAAGFVTYPNVNPMIQIVDDNNNLQTYYVQSVQSNTQITLTTALLSNITNRTYRIMGLTLDHPNLDGQQIFNQ